MILLDTNVLSALMLRDPDVTVVDWLDSQPAESIWTTSITVFEIRTGLELLNTGRRRAQLETAFDQLLSEELDGRIQSFDRTAALAAGTVAAARQRAGLHGSPRRRDRRHRDRPSSGSGYAEHSALRRARGRSRQPLGRLITRLGSV